MCLGLKIDIVEVAWLQLCIFDVSFAQLLLLTCLGYDIFSHFDSRLFSDFAGNFLPVATHLWIQRKSTVSIERNKWEKKLNAQLGCNDFSVINWDSQINLQRRAPSTSNARPIDMCQWHAVAYAVSAVKFIRYTYTHQSSLFIGCIQLFVIKTQFKSNQIIAGFRPRIAIRNLCARCSVLNIKWVFKTLWAINQPYLWLCLDFSR